MQILFQLIGSDVKSDNVTDLGIEAESETESVASFSLDSESGSETFGTKDEEILPFLSTKPQTRTVDFKLDTLTTFKDTPLTEAKNAVEPISSRSLLVQDQSNTSIDSVSMRFETSIRKGNVAVLDTKSKPSDKQVSAREFAVTDVSSQLTKAKGFDEVQGIKGRSTAPVEFLPQTKPVAIAEEAKSNSKTLVPNEKVTVRESGEISEAGPTKTSATKRSPSPAFLSDVTELPNPLEKKGKVETVGREANAKSSTLTSPGAALPKSGLFPIAPQRTEGLSLRDKVLESDGATQPLHRSAQSLADRNSFKLPASLDKAPLKQTTVEIRFNPTSAENAQADQQEVNLTERRTALSQPELISQQKSLVAPLTIRKPEAKQHDSKITLAPGRRSVIEPDGPIAVPELAKQSNQASQANAQQSPLALSTPASTFEPSLLTDGTQARDTGIQISGESSETRKDSTTLSKVEAMARPVVHQLAQAAKTMSDGSIEVRLAPEELGRVRLSLNPGETNITVHISAERQETMDLIRRNLELFSQSLKQEGFSNLSFSFGGSGNEQDTSKEETPDIILSDENQIGEDASNPPHSARVPASGQLDIRI